MTKLAIRIQHASYRPRHLAILLYALQLQPNDNYRVIENDKGTWESCKACLGSLENDDTHILVLQDDTLPSHNLIAAAEKIAEVAGDQPVTLFTNDGRAPGAQSLGYNYLEVKVWFMAQAYILSKRFIASFIDWDSKHAGGTIEADDEHLALYCYANKIPVLATIPSLVDHLGWRTTTIKSRERRRRYFELERRVASTFLGTEHDADKIDWTKGIERAFPDPDKWQRWDVFSSWVKEE